LLLVFCVLIVPRVTVGVVDKTGGSAVKVVANVKSGMAFLGSVTSTVGRTLTGLFETAVPVAMPATSSPPTNSPTVVSGWAASRCALVAPQAEPVRSRRVCRAGFAGRTGAAP
jgi:hypothetical protein